MADVEEDEFQGAGVGLDFKDLVPLSVSLVPYVVLWPSDLQQGADLESLFLIVIKRAGGLIGALPLGVISDREIASGSSEANPHALLGASTTIMVPGVYQNSQGVWEPSESEVALLVADFTSDVAQLLRPMTEDDTESFPFVTDHIEIFPEPSHVVSQVMEWLATQGLSVPEGPYQSDAQEVTAQSGGATPPAKSSTPRRQVGPKGATSSVKPSPKPKRVTTAALAESLEGVLSSLPALSSQIETLVAKQEVLERQLVSSSSVPKQLAKPLTSSLALSKPPSLTTAASMVRSPPRTQQLVPMAPPLTPAPAVAPVLHRELEEELQAAGDAPSVAQAMLAQSAALTQLVAHMASHADPLLDTPAGSTTSTRGAAGRAKLQAELAQHSGVFFEAVQRAMARRMSPTMAFSELTADQLLAQGVSGVRYLERFGGYGRHRDLGLLQYQVMTIFDFLMVGNVGAAKDILALTAVMIEQAVLDNGRFDIAALLSLMEDPPSTIFMNRQILSTSRSRAFAPLADQRWITVALAYLKEMDTIASRRQEYSSGSTLSSPMDPGGDQAKAKAKAKQKGKGKGRGRLQEVAEEEG